MRRGPRIVALSVALALVGASPAAGDSLFSGPVSWPAGDAQDVVIANLNKDSIPDLATADNQPAQASVLLGTGNGAFGTAVGLPLTGHPHEIRAADFNRDTNIDLAVSEQDTGNVAILLNAGDGTFGSPIGVSAAGNAYALAVGDVNGDAKADLVVGDNTSSAIHVLLGDGAGNFGVPISTNLSAAATDLAVADLNGDSKLDVVASESGGAGGGSFNTYLGAGDGTFTQVPGTNFPGLTNSVATADLDNDGDVDAAIGVDGFGIGIALNDGHGHLTAGIIEGKGASVPSDVAAADLNGDGAVDLGATGGPFVTLLNQGFNQGEFDGASDHGGNGVGLALGDLDGDTRPDAVLAATGQVQVFRNIIGKVGPPPLPPPAVAKTANVAPVRGTILVKQPGSRKFIRLEEGAQVRVGSELDATKGTVRLTSAAGGGKTQSGLFNGGIFKIGQKKGAHPFTDLKLTQQLRCVSSHKPVGTAAKRPRSRQLFGNAHGRFRTRGRHSVATIRGTKWLVKDTCKTTLTRSIRGTVVVRDLVKRRTVTLKSGQSYLARRGNR